MKFFQKYIYWVCCTLILLSIAFFCLVKEELSAESLEILPQFYIETAAGEEKISIFHAEEEKYYVFLPSYADMNKLKVWVTSGEKTLLGESELLSDTNCSGFALETGYDLVVNGNVLGELLFYQSANIATMHIQIT